MLFRSKIINYFKIIKLGNNECLKLYKEPKKYLIKQDILLYKQIGSQSVYGIVFKCGNRNKKYGIIPKFTAKLQLKSNEFIKELKILKELTKIARRRNKVMDLVFKSEETKTVKQMAKQDKERIGYKPEEGQTQWTRCCQNSGEGMRRRPTQYTPENMAELTKMGYKLNKKTGEFERRTMIKNSKGKKEEVQLHTLKFAEFDKEGEPTGNEIHYACDPEINGEHFYVGFLSRCKNPYGHCMPCCFKKDPAETKNKTKQKFYQQCLGVEEKKGKSDKEEVEEETLESQLEKFYILHDTNKLQEGRLGLLPKYLDFFFT